MIFKSSQIHCLIIYFVAYLNNESTLKVKYLEPLIDHLKGGEKYKIQIPLKCCRFSL